MKRKSILFLLVITIAITLVACGSKTEETTSSTVTDEEWNGIVEEVYDSEEESERGEEVEENTGYKRSSKWDELEDKYMAVQIKDYFFENGMTVQEVYDLVKDDDMLVWNSYMDVEDHTYYPDEMKSVDYGQTYRIDIGPDVDISIINPYDTEIAFKDCICYNFSFSLRNPDVYVLNSHQSEILYTWTADDIKEMMQSGGMFDGFEIITDNKDLLEISIKDLDDTMFKEYTIDFWLYNNTVETITMTLYSN